jgi:hypothetical protein
MAETDRQFVIKKLGLTEQEFEQIMAAPPKTYWDYPNCENEPPWYDIWFQRYSRLRSLNWRNHLRIWGRRLLRPRHARRVAARLRKRD